MLPMTTTRSKPRTSVVLFDGTKHRNRYAPSFAAGLAPATRWCGEYRAVGYTAADEAFATELFGDPERLARLDAYEAALEQDAWEAECVARHTAGFCL